MPTSLIVIAIYFSFASVISNLSLAFLVDVSIPIEMSEQMIDEGINFPLFFVFLAANSTA